MYFISIAQKNHFISASKSWSQFKKWINWLFQLNWRKLKEMSVKQIVCWKAIFEQANVPHPLLLFVCLFVEKANVPHPLLSFVCLLKRHPHHLLLKMFLILFFCCRSTQAFPRHNLFSPPCANFTFKIDLKYKSYNPEFLSACHHTSLSSCQLVIISTCQHVNTPTC